MTDWDAIAETGKEPDTLAKVIKDIGGDDEGALLQIMKAMLPEPTEAQCALIREELGDIYYRIVMLEEGERGDEMPTEAKPPRL